MFASDNRFVSILVGNSPEIRACIGMVFPERLHVFANHTALFTSRALAFNGLCLNAFLTREELKDNDNRKVISVCNDVVVFDILLSPHKNERLHGHKL